WQVRDAGMNRRFSHERLLAVTYQLCGTLGIFTGNTGSVQRPKFASGAPGWVSDACQLREPRNPSGSSSEPFHGAPSRACISIHDFVIGEVSVRLLIMSKPSRLPV